MRQFSRYTDSNAIPSSSIKMTVPLASILAKDSFLQNLALDEDVNFTDSIPVGNPITSSDVDELLLMNQLWKDLERPKTQLGYPLSPNSYNTNYINHTHNNESQLSNLQQDYLVPYTSYNHSALERNTIDEYVTATTSKRKGSKSNGKDAIQDAGKLAERCRQLEEANKNLQARINSQELRGKHAKDLVQQLKQKEETIESLKANVASKQKAIDSLKTLLAAKNATRELRENSEQNQERAEEIKILEEKIQILQGHLKESKKREQRARDIYQSAKEQIAKKIEIVKPLEDQIDKLKEENTNSQKQLKKLESENGVLATKLQQLTQQYENLATTSQQFYEQATQLYHTHRTLLQKVASLEI